MQERLSFADQARNEAQFFGSSYSELKKRLKSHSVAVLYTSLSSPPFDWIGNLSNPLSFVVKDGEVSCSIRPLRTLVEYG